MTTGPDVTTITRERLQTFFELSPDATLLHNDQGEITAVNHEAEDMLGVDREDLLGTTIFDLDPTTDRETTPEFWDDLDYGETATFESVHRQADGQHLPVEVSIRHVLVDEDPAYLAFVRDISARVKREEELAETEERLSLALEAGDAGVWEWDVDTNEVLWDDSMEQLVELEPGTFPGTYEAFIERVHPEDRETLAEEIETVLETGERATYTIRLETADGPYRWIDTRLRVVTTEGTPDRVVGVGIDVTEQYNHRRNLEKYEQLVESAEDVLWTFEGVFDSLRYINSRYEDIFGQPIDRLAADPTAFVEAVHPEDRDLIRSKIKKIGNENPVDYEVRVNPGEDYSRWVWIKGHPIIEDGDLVAVSGFARDISDRKQREQDLHRYESIVENMDDVVFAVDTEGTVEYVNPVTAKYAGLEQGELVGESIADSAYAFTASAKEAERWLEAFERAIETEDPTNDQFPVQIEIELEVADGRVIADQWISPLVRDGTVEGAFVISRDITERREREIYLEKAQDVADIGWWQKEVPSDEIYWSERVYDMWGADGSDGRLDHETFMSFIHPEDATDVEKAWEAALAGREPYDVEHRIITGDGDVRWMREIAEFEYDSDGEPVRAFGVVQDITEQREYERQLESERERFQALTETAPDPVFIADVEAREIIEANAAAANLIETEQSDVLGSSIADLHPEEDIEKYMELFNGVGSEPVTFEELPDGSHVEVVTATGDTVPVQISSVVADLEEESVIIGIFRDVSDQLERERELKAYQEQLEESNERLQQFAYVVSHDLQEPLRMVSSYMDLLEDEYRDDLDEEAKEYIDFAVDGAERMSAMIDDLLAFSRVRTRGGDPEPVDATEPLENALHDLTARIDESEATIDYDDLPTVGADPSQLSQLFQNLVSNAIDYAGNGPPQVQITATESGGMVEFAVADDGVGIPVADQDQVFDLFSRGRNATGDGTGVGLSICQRIVERHDGDIWIESAEGEGTTISFTLPAAGEAK